MSDGVARDRVGDIKEEVRDPVGGVKAETREMLTRVGDIKEVRDPVGGDGFNPKAREMLPRRPMILPPEILEKSRSDQIDVAKENIFTPEFKEMFGDHWFKMGLEGGRPPIADDLHQIGFGSFFNLALNCFNRGARLSNSASPHAGDGFNSKAREMLPRLPMILPPEILEKSRSDQIDVAKENIFTPEFKEMFGDHWFKMGLEGGRPPIADDLHQIGFGSFFNLALNCFNRGARLSNSASPHAGDGFNSKAREMLPRLPMILPPEILEKSRSDQIDVAKENIFTPEFKEMFGDHWFKMGLEGGRPPIADDLHQIGFGSFFNLALNCFNRGAAFRLSNSASPHAGASTRANAD